MRRKQSEFQNRSGGFVSHSNVTHAPGIESPSLGPPTRTPASIHAPCETKSIAEGYGIETKNSGKAQRYFYLLRIGPPLINVHRETNWSLEAVGKQKRTCPYVEMRLTSLAFSLSIYSLSCLFHSTIHYFNPRTVHLFMILYSDQQMHNYFINYHTATCFDTIVSFSEILWLVYC